MATIRKNIKELIEPRNENKYSRIYDWVMLLAIIIGLLPLMFREQPRIFWYFDLISGLCFIVDYLLRWITADVSLKHKGVKAFFLYPLTPMAIIDLLSILPTFNLLSPTFKVVLCLNGKPKGLGFIVRNTDGNKKRDLYYNSIDQVERITGLDFFPALPDDVENEVEAESDINEWN